MIVIKSYVSYAADFAAVILMIILLVRIRKQPKERGMVKQYFRRFSWMVLLMSFLHLLQVYAVLTLLNIAGNDYDRVALLLSETEQTTWYVIAIVFTNIEIFMNALFIYMWITFLCWYLFEDKDFIRRKFWVGFVPLIIGGVVAAISTLLPLSSNLGSVIYNIAIAAFFVIRGIYLLLALKLLWDYKKQNGYLRFFNPWVFFVPVFAGCVLQDLFEWGFGALGCTAAMYMLYASITSEDRYIDPATGFYKRNFTEYLKGLVKKKKYAPSSAMLFSLDSPEEMKEFSEILKKQLPKDCEPILRSATEIVVLTNVAERGPLMMVMEDVKAEREVKANCILKKKKETTEAFMERAMTM